MSTKGCNGVYEPNSDRFVGWRKEIVELLKLLTIYAIVIVGLS